jgi:hypothetical protein
MAVMAKMMTRNPHSTAPVNRAGSRATAAATTSAEVGGANSKGVVKADKGGRAKAKVALVVTARVAKAARVAVAADKVGVAKAASPTLCAPALTP